MGITFWLPQTEAVLAQVDAWWPSRRAI